MKVIVEADGGSRGNPGPAGYGAVVMAEDGTVLAERAESLGTATNNVAEYSGLIAGLAAARELGASDVAVRMDSKLVVEQMKGVWQVKNPALRELAREAIALRSGFASISFQWIPRAQNAHADRLANQAMDAAMGIEPRRRKSASAPASEAAAAPGAQRHPVGDRAGLAERVRAAALLQGEFLLRSGVVSDHYLDKYRVEADPALLRDAAHALAGLVPPSTDVLAGLELGGVPLVTAVGLQTGHSLRFVRKQAKEYGTRTQVEGGPVEGRAVVLVEDVVTSGGALLDAIDAVRAAGGVVDTAVCLLDRRSGGRVALAARGVDLRAVLTADDLEL